MAEPLLIRATRWRGMPAWRVAGEGLEAVLTATGAHLACLRRRGERLNPLWQPPWPAAHPRAVPADGPWGAWPKAPTNACIVGSSLCLDRFGMPEPGDGRPQHGEAGSVDWSPHPAGPRRFALRATLPLARLEVERSLAISGDAAVLLMRVRSLDGQARRIACCEHTVLGGRFLAGLPGFPALRDPPEGSLRSLRVAKGGWRAVHPRLGRALSASWSRADLPFMVRWCEHRSVERPPWLGRTRALGLEASATPLPGVAPRRGEGLAVPARGWRAWRLVLRWTDAAQRVRGSQAAIASASPASRASSSRRRATSRAGRISQLRS